MRITLTVEVESREALAAILQAGRDNAMYDCQIINFRLGPTPAPAGPLKTPPKITAMR